MTCVSCATSLAEGARFCVECGAPQPVTAGSRATVAGQPSAEPAPDPRIGLTIEGRYRLDARLGQGGMATVYRATRLLIGDVVAVKLLHAEQLRDAQGLERFRREAQAAARIKHSNAVTIHDFGVTADGLAYLVMELVEGTSLRALLKERGPLVPSTAIEIIGQVCSALDEAHAQNVVHRDLKPDNIIVRTSANGVHVKVLDFGIARLRDAGDAGNLTQTGSVMGTPHYMSPEQCLGEELDGRSDIYSIGVLLYEMLAGIVPFNSPTSMAVVVQHVNTTPASIRVLNVSIPASVEAVVMRALAKRREGRPQTARALADELSAAATGLQPASFSASNTPALNPTVQMPTPWSGATGIPQAGVPAAAPPKKPGHALAWNTMTIAAAAITAVSTLGGAGWWLFAGSKDEITQPPAVTVATAAEAAPSVATPAEAHTAGTGTLRIHAPADTSVQIDGSPVGRVPDSGLLTLSGIPAGRRLLSATRNGFRPDQRAVLMAQGQEQDLTIRLTPLPGALIATANVSGVAFQVAGGRRYEGEIRHTELPPGTYRITASKAGYQSASADAIVRPGETARLELVLEKVSADDLLADATTAYRNGHFDRAAATARAVLTSHPGSGRAAALLGNSSFRMKRFADSITYFKRAIDLGEEVTIPANHRHGGALIREGFCSGSVVLSRRTIGYRGTHSQDHNFTTPSTKILEVRDSPLRVDTRVAIVNGAKEDKKNYDFVHPRAVRRGADSSGLVTELRCGNCDDSMEVLYALLQHLARR